MVRPGYKQTEVGEIPEDWSTKKIGELMHLINGRAFKPSDWKEYGLPIIRIQNLNDIEAPFNYYSGPIEEKNRVEKGDLLFAWSGTKGTSFGARIWAGKTGVLNQHIFKVIPDQKKLTRQYALIVLHEVQGSIEKQAHGFKASFVHVKKSDLEGVKLPLPPSTAEQQAIAGALGDVDGLLAGLGKLIAKKRAIKTATMQQLLTGKTRLPGFGGEWKECLLGDIMTLQRGFDLPARMRKTGITPIVSSSGVIGTHNYPLADGPGVVTGRYGTIGEVFFIHENFWPLNTTLFVSDFKGSDPLFISLLLKTIDFKNFSGKSGVPGVNRNDIHGIPIICPPFAEQKAIATVLSDMDSDINALEARLAKTRAIKQGMMQELLTGRTRLL